MHSDHPLRQRPTSSIVIPAHNEERAIGRLLEKLVTVPGEFEVVVLCNGCTDRTVEAARRFEPAVRVIELPEPSKRAALKRGDVEARVFPRLYVDSDVEIGADDVRALVAALHGPVLAAAPTRVLPREGVSLLVRWYYDVWEQLPQVRGALFGRGVIAVSAAGWERIRALPPMMSDDLVMTAAFEADERIVVERARVVVWPPRTMRDLMRRRVRVNTGNAQVDQEGGRRAELTTSSRDLVQIARQRPTKLAKLAVFGAVTFAARLAARRRIRSGDFTTWLRDESSRQAAD